MFANGGRDGERVAAAAACHMLAGSDADADAHCRFGGPTGRRSRALRRCSFCAVRPRTREPTSQRRRACGGGALCNLWKPGLQRRTCNMRQWVHVSAV